MFQNHSMWIWGTVVVLHFAFPPCYNLAETRWLFDAQSRVTAQHIGGVFVAGIHLGIGMLLTSICTDATRC